MLLDSYNMNNREIFQQKLLQWNNYLISHPQDYQAYIRRGMVNFQLAKIPESIADFDRAEVIEPKITPYLWQRGLSYYYAQRYNEAAKQFLIDLKVNRQDIEETIWQYLCLARDLGQKEAKNCLDIKLQDSRQIMREVYLFYTEQKTETELLLAGDKEGKRGNFYAHLYLGLYYEVREEREQAREYIVKAANNYPLDDYMWYLACVHQQLRQWK